MYTVQKPSPALHYPEEPRYLVDAPGPSPGLQQGTFSGGIRPPLTAHGHLCSCLEGDHTSSLHVPHRDFLLACFPPQGYHEMTSSALLSLFLLKFYFGQSHRKSDIFLTSFPKSITDALHITVCMEESLTSRTTENPNCAESRERAPQKPTDTCALERVTHTMFSEATTKVSSLVSPPAIYSHLCPR